ncbi:hypothetical protein BG006_004136, partial [Podila minutissima]
MASIKIKGINRSDIATLMEGFFISEAWYLKKSSYPPPPQAIGTTSSISHPSKQPFQGPPVQELPAREPSPQESPIRNHSPELISPPSPPIASAASTTSQKKSTSRPPSPNTQSKSISKHQRYYAYGFSAQIV